MRVFDPEDPGVLIHEQGEERGWPAAIHFGKTYLTHSSARGSYGRSLKVMEVLVPHTGCVLE